MIVLFLTGMVAMILMRTLHRDIARYNAQAGAQAGGDLDAAGLVLVDPEEAQEETGWKLVHGDVFRPPQVRPHVAPCWPSPRARSDGAAAARPRDDHRRAPCFWPCSPGRACRFSRAR
jgi:hypothetical protein